MYIIKKSSQEAVAYIDDTRIRILDGNEYKLISDEEWQEKGKSNKSNERKDNQ